MANTPIVPAEVVIRNAIHMGLEDGAEAAECVCDASATDAACGREGPGQVDGMWPRSWVKVHTQSRKPTNMHEPHVVGRQGDAQIGPMMATMWWCRG